MHVRRAAVAVAVCVATVVIIGAAAIVNRTLSRAWERSLRGPFFGAAVLAATNFSENCTLAIPSKSVLLCVSETNTFRGPVLTLRSLQGEIFWSRLLSVSNEVKDLRNVKLISVKKRDMGYRVRVNCEWDMGKEDGIIYLGRDLTFKYFALSW